MPKVTIEFNLPEEQEEYKIATEAGSMHSSIWTFYNYLRSESKHGEENRKISDIYKDFMEEFGEFLD